VTKPKTASELEALIRGATGSAEGEMTISIQPLAGLTPNWECIVRYADPGHGMGPGAAFVREVGAVQRRFHLQE
jgi:hypothetical protein